MSDGAPAHRTRTVASVRRHDVVLIGTMGVVAGCGLIYEYLMAHFAGRILGAVEPTIYAMIGLMIVAMGIGAFMAKWVSSMFRGFAWLEVSIGLLGGFSVLTLSAAVAFAYSLPEWIRSVYHVDAGVVMDGGLFAVLKLFASVLPFVLGFILGLLIGMEIPLIARVREYVHETHLPHNLGTMYGADYIGAGIGAAIWILICLKLPVVYAAVGTAAANVLAGVVFLTVYRREIRPAVALWGGHAVLAGLLVVLALFGREWIAGLSDSLFRDRVVYHLQTPYQNVVLTKRHVSGGRPDILSLYINGRVQFASNDERIYHAYLTTPPMLAAYRRDRILVLGGGDGLALRDLWRWSPETVTLIDIDPAVVDLFAGRDENAPDWLSRALVEQNAGSFDDPRLSVIHGDAFIEVERLASSDERFDVVIVDLPDPNHPDLNRLYSDYFYARVRAILSPDGAIAIQSTSPYHAKEAFLSIGKTVSHAGFTVSQYHANVPSFGEWGWTLGTPIGKSGPERIEALDVGETPDGWLDGTRIAAAFQFPPRYFDVLPDIEINRLGSHAVFNYHQEAWESRRGAFYVQDPLHEPSEIPQGVYTNDPE